MDTREFIKSLPITATCARVDANPNMADSANMDHWRVSLRRSDTGQRLTVYFSMGYAHKGKAPETADVLDCLASDSASIESARDFADWCADFGYDTDSRKAHKTYTVCKRQADRLKAFMGAQYDGLLYESDRL